MVDGCVVLCSCVPVVDGCVALPQPTDSGQFVFVSVSTKENDDVIFRDHQVQSGNHEPAGGDRDCVSERSLTHCVRESVYVEVCVSVCLTGRGAP